MAEAIRGHDSLWRKLLSLLTLLQFIVVTRCSGRHSPYAIALMRNSVDGASSPFPEEYDMFGEPPRKGTPPDPIIAIGHLPSSSANNPSRFVIRKLSQFEDTDGDETEQDDDEFEELENDAEEEKDKEEEEEEEERDRRALAKMFRRLDTRRWSEREEEVPSSSHSGPAPSSGYDSDSDTSNTTSLSCRPLSGEGGDDTSRIIKFVNLETFKDKLDTFSRGNEWKLEAINGQVRSLPKKVVSILASAAETGRLRRDLLRALLLRPSLFPASWRRIQEKYEIPTDRYTIDDLARHIGTILPVGMDLFCDHLTQGYGSNDIFTALVLYSERDITEISQVRRFESYLRDYVSGDLQHL